MIANRLSRPNRLVVFARYPEAGRVKTRLIPALGESRAARLYTTLLRKMLAATGELNSDEIALELRVTGEHRREMNDMAAGKFLVRQQVGSDLGEKLSEASRSAFREGVQKLVMSGTDCPELDNETLHQAFEELNNADVVLGPALDGGYYLIATRSHVPELFEEVQWLGERVLEQTQARAKQLGLKVSKLQPLSDIDYVEDLVICRNQGTGFDDVLPSAQPGLLSVIVPTFNEESTLELTLRSLPRHESIEVIVVDGGSTDKTVDIAKRFASSVIPCRKGRARQMNAGAALSRGEAILFLHADSRPPSGFADTVWSILNQGAIAGAFKLGIDGKRLGLRWVESGANFRSKMFQVPYGDQGLFLLSDVFFKAGGFRHLPFMEDYELCQRLRAMGKIAIARESTSTSDRRWRRLGIVRTTLLNQMYIAAFRIGVPPKKLAQWYDG